MIITIALQIPQDFDTSSDIKDSQEPLTGTFSRFVYLKKFSLNFSSPSIVICASL